MLDLARLPLYMFSQRTNELASPLTRCDNTLQSTNPQALLRPQPLQFYTIQRMKWSLQDHQNGLTIQSYNQEERFVA